MKYFGKKKMKAAWNTVRGSFLFFAHADEVDGGKVNPPAVDYEQLIAKARQEEKNKLYPEIQKLKAQNEALTQQSNENLLAKGRAEAELEALKAQIEKGESEEITKLKAKVEALEEENKKLKESTPDENKIRAELQKEYEVKDYIREKIAESQKDGKLLKAFSKNVSGKTKEEVDASLAEAIKASDEVRAELGRKKKNPDDKDTSKDSKNDDEENKDKGGKGNPPETPPAPNPTSFKVGEKEYTQEYIRGLDPRSDEYKKFRKEVLGLR